MKKIKILYIILSICLLVLCGCNNTENESNNTNNNSNAEKMSIKMPSPKKELEISSFSSKILDKNPNRVNNITLSCNKLNEVIVKNGDTFSFCDTIGEVSADTGYKEADVLDENGEIIKGFDGGNCQVSSTLYNAVLQIDNIEIIERHEHSKRVYYVEKDKDAAVLSSTKLDFKFKNNTGYDIKIYASNTNEEVDIKIIFIE